jgi:hypothetical protein
VKSQLQKHDKLDQITNFYNSATGGVNPIPLRSSSGRQRRESPEITSNKQNMILKDPSQQQQQLPTNVQPQGDQLLYQ